MDDLTPNCLSQMINREPPNCLLARGLLQIIHPCTELIILLQSNTKITFNDVGFRKEVNKAGVARILAIDGGGIRGIIPALILQRIS